MYKRQVLYHYGSEKLATKSNGIDVTGHTETDTLNVSGISTFTGDVSFGSTATFGDNDKLIFGDDNDLEIFHNSSNGNTIIQEITGGNLVIKGSNLFLQSSSGEDFFKGDADGAVSLFFDDSKKFETTADGIDVTGHVETDTLNVSGLSTFTDDVNFTQAINVDGDTELDNLNVSGISTFTGTTNIANLSATGLSTISRVEATNIVSGGATFTSGGVKFQTFAQFANNQSLLFGGGNDLEIFHDGLNAYIVDVGVGSMFIRGTSSIELENDTGSETYARFNIDGASELYYDNSKKIETTSDGVRIIGVTSSTTAKIGAATTFTEDLVVQGDARVTGILTVGTSSIIFDGPNDSISVGGATTVNTSGLEVGITTVHSTGIEVGNSSIHNNGFDIGTTSLHDSGINADNLNISGVGTVGGDLNVTGDVIVGNVNISGVITASTLDISGSVDIDLNVLGNTFYVAETGSDSNDGDNINKPFLSIAQALSVATNGDIVNVSAGTFRETCPLTIPAGVTVKGAGLRATTIRPTTATRQENIFLLNDASTLEDFSIKGSYYDSTNDTGYAFSYASGITIATRSPYIQRVTVLNRGSVVTADDPYGFDTADSPPTSYMAGRGAKVDGSLVTSSSIEAGMLFNEVTFFTPNNKGVILTNGARAEYLNCFHYFASQAIVGQVGTTGIGGNANTRLKFSNPNVTPSANDVVKLYNGSGVGIATGTIVTYSSDYATISGLGIGTFTSVGTGTTQDIRFFQSDGTTQTGVADSILLADYTMFGAEMRSVGCAVEYGTQGVVADGNGVKLRMFATNFNHVGSGKDFSNDTTLTIQANEVVELNSGQVSYVSIDQGGDFRVGDALFIDQETGNVSFAATSYSLDVTGTIDVTDGTNTSTLTPTSITVGGLQLASNQLSSLSGDITIDPSGSSKTVVQGNLDVNGTLNASVVNIDAIQRGDTSISITDTGSDGTIIFYTENSEAFRINNTQTTVFTGAIDANGNLDVDGTTELDVLNVAETATFSANIDANGDLDVDGHTYLDNVNVSGIVTSNAGFAGTVLSQDGTGYVLIPGASQNDTSQLYNTNLYDSLGRVVTNMVADQIHWAGVADGLTGIPPIHVGVVTAHGQVESTVGFAGTVLSQDGTGYVLIPGASANDTSQLYNTNLYNDQGQVVTNMVADAVHFAGVADGLTGTPDIKVGIVTATHLQVTGVSTFANTQVSTSVASPVFNTDHSSIGSIEFITTGTAAVTGHILDGTAFRSVEYLIQAVDGANMHLTKILAIHDGAGAVMTTEYGTVFNNSPLASYDMVMNGPNAELMITAATPAATTYKITFTAIAI